MTTTQNTKTTVTLVDQFASNGRYARKASRVTFSDGRTVTFCERIAKRVAIAQAEQFLARHPDYSESR